MSAERDWTWVEVDEMDIMWVKLDEANGRIAELRDELREMEADFDAAYKDVLHFRGRAEEAEARVLALERNTRAGCDRSLANRVLRAKLAELIGRDNGLRNG